MTNSFELAEFSFREGKYSDALAFIEKEIILETDAIDRCVLYARIQSQLKNWTESFKAWSVINSRYPDRLDGAYEKAQAVLELGQIDYAASLYKKIQINHPKVINGWIGLAKVYITIGDWSNAISCLDQMPDEFRNNKHAIYFRAESFLELKRYQEALTQFKELLGGDYPYSIIAYQKILEIYQLTNRLNEANNLTKNFFKIPDTENAPVSDMVVFGESHIGSLAKAYSDVQKNNGINIDFVKLPQVPLFSGANLSEEYMEIIRKIATCKKLFLSIGGNEHNVIGLCGHPKAYTLSNDYFPKKINYEISYINRTLIKDALRAAMKSFEIVCRFIASVTDAQVYFIETPPPCPDINHIKATIDPKFRKELELYGVGEKDNRYILWQCRNEIVKELATQLNSFYLKTPAIISDENGFMKREYWGDATHGNVEYGKIFLKKLINLESES